jgi:hypothetical protein
MEGTKVMSDLMTAAVTTLQSRVYDQIAVSILKSSAQAQQTVADLLAKNAEQIAELSRQTTPHALGRIDIYA